MLPWFGAVADRRGNVPMLAAAQAIISLAPLCLLMAGPHDRQAVVLTYACWLAYGGINVALPNLMLGLSPPGRSAPYAAAWFAWTHLAYSLSVMLGGVMLHWLAEVVEPAYLTGAAVDRFFVIFIASWILKAAGVALALRIPEPAK